MPPAGAAAPADSIAAATVPVSVQTIANAYGNYTMKSLEETRSFVERLTGDKVSAEDAAAAIGN